MTTFEPLQKFETRMNSDSNSNSKFEKKEKEKTEIQMTNNTTL